MKTKDFRHAAQGPHLKYFCQYFEQTAQIPSEFCIDCIDWKISKALVQIIILIRIRTACCCQKHS